MAAFGGANGVMATMSEKQFEKKVLCAMHRRDYWAKHLTVSIDGFPDILCMKDYGGMLVEVKKYSGNPLVRELFTTAQVPFYIGYTKLCDNLFVMCERDKDVVAFHVDKTLAKCMLNYTIEDTIAKSDWSCSGELEFVLDEMIGRFVFMRDFA